jgi:hypothetical protein
MSTVVARRIGANPSRAASAAWTVIVGLLSVAGTDGRTELEAVAGIAASLIADECFKDAPAIVSGSGPRVRIYCLYDEDAVEGSAVNENALSFNVTDGDWEMSLPCYAEDLNWVTSSLKQRSSRITARDLTIVEASEDGKGRGAAKGIEINVEGFLNA